MHAIFVDQFLFNREIFNVVTIMAFPFLHYETVFTICAVSEVVDW